MASPDEPLYHLKAITFQGKQLSIIMQSENGPCPMLAICNVLLMRGKVSLPAGSTTVPQSRLLAILADHLLAISPQGTSAYATNQQRNLADVMGILPKLTSGIDVNPCMHSPAAFEFTDEIAIFDLVDIPLLHGWLVDPRDAATATAIGSRSYNQLINQLIAALSAMEAAQEGTPESQKLARTLSRAPSAAAARSASRQLSSLPSDSGEAAGKLPLARTGSDAAPSAPQLSISSREDSDAQRLAQAIALSKETAAGDVATRAPEPHSEEAALADAIAASLQLDRGPSEGGADERGPGTAVASSSATAIPSRASGSHRSLLAPTYSSLESDSLMAATPTTQASASDFSLGEGLGAETLHMDENREGRTAPQTAEIPTGEGADAAEAENSSGVDARDDDTEAAPGAAAAAPLSEVSLGAAAAAPGPAAAAAPPQHGEPEEGLPSGDSAAESTPGPVGEGEEAHGAEQGGQHDPAAWGGGGEMTPLEGSGALLPTHEAVCPPTPGEAPATPTTGRSPEVQKELADALLIQSFLEASSSQLTEHGLVEVAAALAEHQLAVFFRNNHFSVVVKHDGALYTLVTDAGYLREPEVVWERMRTVHDTGFHNSAFRSYQEAKEAARLQAEAETAAALAQIALQDHAALQGPAQGGGPSGGGGHTQHNMDADMALAMQLQADDEAALEEERRAARARAQQQQQPQTRVGQPEQQQQQQQQQHNRRGGQQQQRRRAQGPSTKESACAIM